MSHVRHEGVVFLQDQNSEKSEPEFCKNAKLRKKVKAGLHPQKVRSFGVKTGNLVICASKMTFVVVICANHTPL